MILLSRVLFNGRLSDGLFLMRAESPDDAKPGQFYMLRAWGDYPLLSRPLSVFDSDGVSVTFLYKVVGEGTNIFSKLGAGDEITLLGPYGNGFPAVAGKVALVGGGVGIAPLYLAAKCLKGKYPDSVADIFLGFSGEAVLVDEFKKLSDNLTIDIGGFITEKIDPFGYDFILTCGPHAMMKALYEKCRAGGVGEKLYASAENRMACGTGMCLVCSCMTTDGNKRVCRDGPVFSGKALFEV